MLVVLGLGSNKPLGSLDSIHLLARAYVMLSHELAGLAFSSVYRTRPMYVESQADFYNMIVCGETNRSPFELLEVIHSIEAALGRDRAKEIRNGERTIDIDIELFGSEEIHSSDGLNPMRDLDIPHPRICERPFVLIPLLEILPESAEIQKKDFFESALSRVGTQGVVMAVTRGGFAKIIGETETHYGRAGWNDFGKK